MKIVKGKSIVKVHKTLSKDSVQIVDYVCEYCGTIHENIVLKLKNEKRSCCSFCKMMEISTNNKLSYDRIYNRFLFLNTKNNNYIIDRLLHKDRNIIKQMLERFFKNDDYKLLFDKAYTIGLKNTFAKTVWIDDLVIKNKKEDDIDYKRYSNNVERYEKESIRRSAFKTYCKSLNLKFEDFEEVFADEFYYCISKSYEVKSRQYNYFFKHGTI